MENYKHIFFDLDHTLWDFDKNSVLSFQQIFKEQNISIKFDDFIQAYIPINAEYWKLYREEKISSKSDLRYRRLRDTFSILNYKVSDDFINTISVDYLNYLPNNNYLISGALELLNYLKPKYKLHIITNGFKEVQHKKLQASGIKDFFEIIVTSESVGLKKPNPKVFEYALEQANATPEESVMVGDNYEADVLGAFNVGVLPIYFDISKKNNNKSLLSVNTLLDLKQFL